MLLPVAGNPPGYLQVGFDTGQRGAELVGCVAGKTLFPGDRAPDPGEQVVQGSDDGGKLDGRLAQRDGFQVGRLPAVELCIQFLQRFQAPLDAPPERQRPPTRARANGTTITRIMLRARLSRSVIRSAVVIRWLFWRKVYRRQLLSPT